jgi:predicted nucleotidyltransferase
MQNIFSTSERIRIIEKIIFREDNLSVNDIASKVGLSKGLVSKYFDMLRREGILIRKNGMFFVRNSAFTKAIKILLNIKKASLQKFKKYPFIKSAGLYGSCAKGENNEDSDIDLWVRVEKTKDEKLAAFTSELRKKMPKAKILLLTDDKIEQMKKEDVMFYHALTFGSIILFGDKVGI